MISIFTKKGGTSYTFPSNVRIVPNQAWMNCMLDFNFIDYVQQNIINFSGQHITNIDSSWLGQMSGLVNNATGLPPNVDLSGNALSQGAVDGILSVYNGSGIFGGTLNLSGGTNAGLDTIPQINGRIEIYPGGPSTPGSGSVGAGTIFLGSGNATNVGNTPYSMSITFDDTVLFADSSFSPGDFGATEATMTIGVSDTPSKLDVMNLILSFWGSANFTGTPAIIAGNTGIGIDYTAGSDLTVSSAATDGTWANTLQAGQVFQENPDWSNLVTNLGWTILIN